MYFAWLGKVKVKSAYEPIGHQAGAYPGFSSMIGWLADGI